MIQVIRLTFQVKKVDGFFFSICGLVNEESEFQNEVALDFHSGWNLLYVHRGLRDAAYCLGGELFDQCIAAHFLQGNI